MGKQVQDSMMAEIALGFRGTSIGWKTGTADAYYIKFNKDHCNLGPDGFWQRWLDAHLH